MFYKIALAVISAFLAKYVVIKILTRRLQARLGTEPIANDERGNLYGFYSALTFSDHKSKGSLYEFLRVRNSELAVPAGETFLTSNLGGDDRIVTHDTQNLMAVLATHSAEYVLENRQDATVFFRGSKSYSPSSEKAHGAFRLPRPHFAHAQPARLSVYEPHFQALEASIRLRQGMPLEILKPLSHFAFCLTMDVILGDWGLGSSTPLWQVEEAFNTALKYCSDRDHEDSRFKEITPATFDAALNGVYGFIDDHVRRALSYLKEQLASRTSDEYAFLYDIARDTRDPLVLRNDTVSMLLAGHNNASATISWAIFELARNPALWQKLRAEVLENLGQGPELISADTVQGCVLLHAVIKETLRMYPPVAVATSTALRHTTLPQGGGIDGTGRVLVRKGQRVTCLIYAAQRSPVYYGQGCLEFDPLRWLAQGLRTPAWLYIPFGAGVGGCMGKQLALSQTAYVLARLCQLFECLGPARENQMYPPRMSYDAAMTNMDGVNVKFS